MSEELEPQNVPDTAPPVSAEPVPEPQNQSPPAPEPTPAPEPSFSFLQAARDAGYPVDSFETDEAAARAFLAHTRRLEQTSQQPPEPEPEPQPEDEWNPDKHFAELWKVPEYKPEWLESLEVDPQTGQIRPKANVPWGTAQKYMDEYAAYQAALKRNHQSLFMEGNPYQRMWDALRPVLEREGYVRRQDLESEFGQREVATHVQRFEQEYSQYLASDEGKRFIAYATNLHQQYGLPPDAALHATVEAFRPKSNREWQAAPHPEPEPQPNPPKPTSFIEDSVRKAGHRPSAGAPAPVPTKPGQQDPESVRSIFSRAHTSAGRVT